MKYDCGGPDDAKQNKSFIRRGLAAIFFIIEVTSCEDPVGASNQTTHDN